MLARLVSLDGPDGATGAGAPGDGATGIAATGAGATGVALVVIPLLRPAHVDALGLARVVVVDCPTEVAVERLVEARGMDEADARARIAAQPSREERLAIADYVVDNGSTLAHVAAEVDALWEWLVGRARRDAAT